jgi:hypothetical protein
VFLGNGSAVHSLRLAENGRTQHLSMAENAGFRNGGIAAPACFRGRCSIHIPVFPKRECPESGAEKTLTKLPMVTL